MGEQRRVEYMPLDQIQRAPRNPRRHDEAGIRASLTGFGVVDLPTLDERTGRLVAGHGRLDQLAGLHRAGAEAPEGVQVTDGGWLVPVVRGWSSTSEQEAEAYLVATNKLGENGQWVDDGLAALLADLDGHGGGLRELTGFTDNEFDHLLRSTDHLGKQATAFLDDFIHPAPAAPNGGPWPPPPEPVPGQVPPVPPRVDATEPAEAPVPQPVGAPPPVFSTAGTSSPPPTYVQLSWTVTLEQRETVRTALKVAQAHQGCPTSTEALVAIARHFLDTVKGPVTTADE